MTTVTSEITVNVPVTLAYNAFTRATSLREWLCDMATVVPRPRGRIYLWWNGDFYSSGHFLDVKENELVKFRWFSNIDAAPTEIQVTFQAQEKGSLVRLEHTVPDEPEWAKVAEGFRGHWDGSLKNLKSVLETGIDRRIADRPMLGIYPGDFTPEQAEQLHVPVKDGFRLDNVVEGMGAAAAGLQKNDVIIDIDGNPVKNDFSTFLGAIAGKKGGDEVQVTFYRGPLKQSVRMTLTKRPMPEVPFNIAELVEIARKKYAEAQASLEACLVGVSDAEAAVRPSPDEWCALEVLAHLLQGERYNTFFIAELIGGHERWADDWGGNIDAHMRATVTAHPGIASMLMALRQASTEILSLLASLPEDFVQNRGSFYRVGSIFVQEDHHIASHIEQIQAAIAAARK